MCGAVVVRYDERGCCRLERAWGCGKFARVAWGVVAWDVAEV